MCESGHTCRKVNRIQNGSSTLSIGYLFVTLVGTNLEKQGSSSILPIMKTVFLSTALSFLIVFQAAAIIIPMVNEDYVDDIPFSTTEVYLRTAIQPNAELTADDIPFNTGEIAARALIPIEEESTVDDIPFNTAGIAFAYKPCCLPISTEAYVDDIPFNTADIAARANIPMEEENAIPWEEPWPAGQMYSSTFHIVPDPDITEPILRLRLLMNELAGICDELGEVGQRLIIIDMADHDDIVMEIDRVFTEEMLNIFENRAILKFF